MGQFCMIDGRPAGDCQAVLPLWDMGLLYGFSLFETMLVQNGRPVLLESHLDRMISSARQLGMSLLSHDELAGMCHYALAKFGLDRGVLRLTATAGTAQQNGHCIIMLREGIPYTEEQYEKGVALVTLDFPRHEKSPLVFHKTANYLENILGRRQAQRQGYDEGLFLNTRGQVTECTASNIFIVRGDKLLTPPVQSGLLPGTIRRLVLENAAAAGYTGLETALEPLDLRQTEECFVTNSLLGVMPVTSLDDVQIGNGKPGPVTVTIMAMYRAALVNL